jgi:transcriptional regulator with XRE-family HTH domain
VTATDVSKLESAGAAPGIDLADKLATALGVNLADLFPLPLKGDPATVSRAHARHLFDALLKSADQQTFALLNPFLALLVESSGKRA